jgi:low temperature requirement protein LtrA
VAGYVVMRIAMGFQWLRAATQNPQRRSACLTYLTTILVAQAGWVLLLLVEASVSVAVTLLLMVPLALSEVCGPWIAETRKGGTPWRVHHIAERCGLHLEHLAAADDPQLSTTSTAAA